MAKQKTLIDQYCDHLARVGKSPHTVRAYVHDLAAFAHWFEQTAEEDFDPQAVDPRDVQEYKGYLVQKGLKPATINRRLIALGRFFRWSKQEGLIGDNPFEVLEQVLLKEQKDTAPRWLDRKEQLALLRAVRKRENKRDLVIIQTLLGTGLRISELAALKVSDLEISERKGWLYVRKGKGSKARDIPLDNKTRQVLSSYLGERPEDGTERLLLGQRGALSEPGINYLVTKYAYQAKLEDCTSHTLRHTFGKTLVDAGVPLDQVATLMGHESLDTTKVYTRPSKRDLERAVRRAAGELWNNEDTSKTQKGRERAHQLWEEEIRQKAVRVIKCYQVTLEVERTWQVVRSLFSPSLPQKARGLLFHSVLLPPRKGKVTIAISTTPALVRLRPFLGQITKDLRLLLASFDSLLEESK